ncbi:MAG TPA: hypothetical protein VGL73_13745 [Caulobacteraceae bacterium]|jgi:hypothetical protein
MRVLILAMVFSAASALADTPPSPRVAQPPDTVARSQPPGIWRPTADNGLEHLQSGLACPAMFAGYRRTRVDLYDRVGLDVSCNYAADRRDITVYLTRRSGSRVEDALAEAKKELFQLRAAMQPKPISEMRSKAGGLDWVTALYGLNNGLRTGIWMADLDGWTLEYRASYQASEEGQVLGDIAALTAIVRTSAGARLDLCARSPSPARTGVAVTEQAEISKTAMMTALLDGGALGAAAEGKPIGKPAAAITWCVDRPIPTSPRPLLYWRGVTDDGGDALTDRLTPMTDGLAPALVVAPDELANLVARAQSSREHWVATIAGEDQTQVFGYFTGRPSPELLTELLIGIASGKTKALIGYGFHGKTLMISAPPAQ